MYENASQIIRLDIIEENWLEFLKYVKEQEDKREELRESERKMRQAVFGASGLGNMLATGAGADCEKAAYDGNSCNRYYDISVNQFWNWYVTNKL
jgi:hypothetical protein